MLKFLFIFFKIDDIVMLSVSFFKFNTLFLKGNKIE